MGADHQVDLPALDPLEGLPLLGCRHLAAQQGCFQAELLEPAVELQVVLLSEDFRRRDHGDLAVVLDGDQGGHHGDDGLAAADIPLDQAVHRVLRHQVVLDLTEHPSLRSGQTIRQQRGQRLGVLVVDGKGDAALQHQPAAFQGNAKLEEEELVIDQRTQRRRPTALQLFHADLVGRPVDLLQGLRKGQQTVLLDQSPG